MDEFNAYQSSEHAELYDAVYADVGDIAFWEAMAAPTNGGPLLELACGTGRLLVPLAKAGHEITGLDLATHMLERCRAKLQAELPEVRARATVREADMTSFELGQRFAQVFCAFGSFHHLRSAEQQLACLERSRSHLLPGGTLVLDLINPDPAPSDTLAEDPTAAARPTSADTSTGVVGWTDGRRIRSWAKVVGSSRSLQINTCEVTYEITENDGTTRRVTETFPMRFIFRYELEHLLARSGFQVVALYGDYDCSPFVDESLGMIVVAEPTGD